MAKAIKISERLPRETRLGNLCFIYTKVGKVRSKPSLVSTSWILSKQMNSSHSEFKHFAGGVGSLVLWF